MGMSEKEWTGLARSRGLDPATGTKQEPEPTFAGREPDIVTHDLLRNIRDEIKMLVTIVVIGFAVLAMIGIIK